MMVTFVLATTILPGFASDLSSVAPQMTTEAYAVIGGLLVTNIGTLMAMIFYGAKLSFQAGRFATEFKRMQRDVNEAHQAIRKLRDDIHRSRKSNTSV